MINDLVIFTSQPTMSTDTVQMQRYPRGAVARGILSLGLHLSASLAYYYVVYPGDGKAKPYRWTNGNSVYSVYIQESTSQEGECSAITIPS